MPGLVPGMTNFIIEPNFIGCIFSQTLGTRILLSLAPLSRGARA